MQLGAGTLFFTMCLTSLRASLLRTGAENRSGDQVEWILHDDPGIANHKERSGLNVEMAPIALSLPTGLVMIA
jgi:hypothetical protein